ncbi:MAG: hypothetical protein ACI4OY_07240, partial [Aristaeellaceae bacterium]
GCMARRRASEACSYDLLGQRFGALTVVDRADRHPGERALRWKCRCICGKVVEYTSTLLATGKKTSCGCLTEKRYAMADIAGKTFDRLTALYPLEKRDGSGGVIWRCRCACGRETDASYNGLMYGNMRSCGCRKKEHDQALRGYLTHVDGTCIDMLKSRKTPKNNTTGVRGVYRAGKKYLAKIVFQKRQYHLGRYDTLEEAAQARREAEEAINGTVIACYERYQQRAAEDPAWAEAHPVRMQVVRDGQGHISLTFDPAV